MTVLAGSTFARAVCVAAAIHISSSVLMPAQAGAERTRVGEVSIELIAQDFAIDPDAPITVTFRPSSPLAIGDAIVVATYPAMEDRTRLAEFITDYDTLGRATDSLSFELEAIVVAPNGNVTVTIPTESATRSAAAVQFPNQGLYPLLLRVVDDNSNARGEMLTFIDRRPLPSAEPRGTLGVAAIASISTAPLIPGDDTPLPASVTDEIARLIAFPETLALTVDISPDVLARLDPQTLNSVREVMARSLTVSAPRVPFDPSSAADAGLADLYNSLLVEGEDQTRALGEVQTDRSVWLSPTPITTGGANLVRDRGARLLVLSADTYRMADGSIDDFFDYSQLLQTRLASPAPDDDNPCLDGCLPTAVLDPGFEALLLDDSLEPERKAAYLAAHLVLWRDSLAANLSPVTGHTLVLGMPDGSVPDPTTMTRTMDMALGTGAISVTNLSGYEAKTTSQLVGGNEIVITLQSPVPVDISQRSAVLLPLAGREIGVASMLKEPGDRPVRWQDTIETLYSTALDDDDVAAAVASLNAEFDAITSAVVPRTPESFTLSGRRTDMRLRFANTSAETLLIVIQMDAGANKLEFPTVPQLVELPPNAPTEVAVPVEARANGSVTVNLNIVTPVGQQNIMPTIAMQAKVNTLTGLAQLITGGALLVLLTWWVHNLRRSRRTRRNGTSMSKHPSNGHAPPDAAPGEADELATAAPAGTEEGDKVPEPDPVTQPAESASLADS